MPIQKRLPRAKMPSAAGDWITIPAIMNPSNADRLEYWADDCLLAIKDCDRQIAQLQAMNVDVRLCSVPIKEKETAYRLRTACLARIEHERGFTNNPKLMSTPFRIPREDFEIEPPDPTD
jgi:hypothetical protein